MPLTMMTTSCRRRQPPAEVPAAIAAVAAAGTAVTTDSKLQPWPMPAAPATGRNWDVLGMGCEQPLTAGSAGCQPRYEQSGPLLLSDEGPFVGKQMLPVIVWLCSSPSH